MPDSPLLQTPMKVARRIPLKNKMSLKKFQVIWQPFNNPIINMSYGLQETDWSNSPDMD